MVIGQEAFILKYNLRDLQDYSAHPIKTFNDDESVRKALILYVKADTIIYLLKLLPPHEKHAFETIDANRIRTILENALEPLTPRIENMSPLENNVDE